MLLLMLVATTLSAQDVIDKVSDETCSCLEKRLTNDKKDASQIEMVIGLCMMEAGGRHKDELKEKHGIDLTSIENFEKLGELIGEHLAETCDKFIEVLFLLMDDDDSEIRAGILSELEEPAPGISGKVIAAEGEEVLIIKVKEGGRTTSFYCLGEFEGVDVVKQGKALAGKDVMIFYKETSIYSPKSKEFHTVKQITSIEVQ